MKTKLIPVMFITLFSFFLSGCSESTDRNEHLQEEVTDSNVDKIDSINLEVTKCDCLEPLEEYKELCETRFKEGLTDMEKFECTGDSSYIIDAEAIVSEEEMKDYEEDLSLEIKELEEEKIDPISEECKTFLEEYAQAIKDYKSLSDRVDANPEDIGLKITFKNETQELESWSSKPQMFRCSQNESFKKQVEILNGKKEKLLYGE